jgi:CBS domain-containing protein
MSRSDVHLDAMLRHLGAAYYDSLHGRAADADVTRAVEQVASRMGEAHAQNVPAPRQRGPVQHHGRYHSRVRDIMTTDVVTVDRITSYKEIAALLAKHHIGGLPVLMLGRRVAGMVTDADLVAAAARQHRSGWARRRRRGSQQHHALTAEQLMTAPAITIYPDAPIAAAARVMTEHHVRRLPVTAPDGTLIGIVSRRDLLRLFLRPDGEIARQVDELLAEVLPDDPAAVKVTVHDGVVTLTSQGSATGWRDELRLAIRLAADIDGVVEVIDRTASPQPA